MPAGGVVPSPITSSPAFPGFLSLSLTHSALQILPQQTQSVGASNQAALEREVTPLSLSLSPDSTHTIYAYTICNFPYGIDSLNVSVYMCG